MRTLMLLAQVARAFNSGRGGPWVAGLVAASLLTGCGPEETGQAPRQKWPYPSDGIQRVVLKSWRAGDVRTSEGRPGAAIELSARPVLQALRMHGPEPDWRQKPAEEWPFAWEAKREGSTLVLTVRGEARFPHYRYLLEELEIKVPPGLSVAPERQELAPASPVEH